MRPSSLLRNARLGTLLAELSQRDLGSLGVAALLDCSPSSARNYLFELLDAGLLRALPNPAEGSDTTVYRLTPDQGLVDAFKTSLTVAGNAVAAAAERDPLVAALFGAR